MAISPARRARFLAHALPATVIVFAVAVALGVPALASAADKTTGAAVAKAPVKKKPAKPFPLAGNVSLGSTAGLGSFVSGPQNRTSLSGSLSLNVRMSPAPGVTLMIIQGISKTFIDSYGDDFASKARNTFVNDPVAFLLWAPTIGSGEAHEMTEEEKRIAALNPMMAVQGGGKPLALPGDIRVTFAGIFSLGTGRIARYRKQYGTAGIALNLTRNFGSLMLAYRLRYTKLFHEYTNAVVDTTLLTSTSMAREGGVEDLGGGMMATSTMNLSFHLRNRLLMNWNINSLWSVSAMFRVTNLFRYYDAPKDEFSSSFAKAGRGRSDTQLGSLSATMALKGIYWSLSSTTWSAPFTKNNKNYRFPFWDFTSASDNITTVSLSAMTTF